MRKYQRLLDAITYFESDGNEYCTWKTPGSDNPNEIAQAYPVYDKRLEHFIRATDESGLMRTDYLDAARVIDFDNIVSTIERADFQMLRALLTYFVRQERYCEGLWDKAAREGIFLAMLYRLRQLMITGEAG